MAISNSQYDAIMREYDQKQLAAEHEWERRVEEVEEAVPRIKEINEEIAQVSSMQARNAIQGIKVDIETYKKNIQILRDEKLTLLVATGFPADYLEKIYACPICKDTGYVNGRQKCICYQQAVIKHLYTQSGLENILEKENFDTLSYAYFSKDPQFSKRGHTVYENMEQIIKRCHSFVDHFDAKKDNILFTGAAGCGKTFLTHCIAKALMEKQKSVVYLTAVDMFDLLAKKQFTHEEQDVDVDQYLLESDLLIVDDLGTEVSNRFTFVSFFSCLNSRLVNEKPMIISTNLSIQDIRERYTDRVYSRIAGNFMCFDFYGPDIRLAKRYK